MHRSSGSRVRRDALIQRSYAECRPRHPELQRYSHARLQILYRACAVHRSRKYDTASFAKDPRLWLVRCTHFISDSTTSRDARVARQLAL